jgi:hypothetical protein
MKATMVIYVDDLLVATETAEGMEVVKGLLEGRFATRAMGEPQYFLGMNVCYDQEQGMLTLNQQTYVEALLEKYGSYVGMPRTLPMVNGKVFTKEQGKERPTGMPYASLVGALLFLSVCTRPDISFAVGVLTKFVSSPGEVHWEAAVAILGYLMGTKERGIILGRTVGWEDGLLLGYADADWANDLDDRKSVSGGALFMGGSLISWFSRKQGMISTSTAEAEVHALLEMVYSVGNAVAVLEEISFGLLGKGIGVPRILSDNQPGLDAIQSRKGRNKHYDIKIKFIAEGIELGKYRIRKVSTLENVADVLTKAVPVGRFRELISVFMSGVSSNLTIQLQI